MPYVHPSAVIIGIGAIILNGAVIGTGSLIDAGAVVREGMVVPPGSLVLGVPAQVVGPGVYAEERARIEQGARAYVANLRQLEARA